MKLRRAGQSGGRVSVVRWPANFSMAAPDVVLPLGSAYAVDRQAGSPVLLAARSATINKFIRAGPHDVT